MTSHNIPLNNIIIILVIHVYHCVANVRLLSKLLLTIPYQNKAI